ncbi:GNAT family N-acetyltransferase [Afipia sp. GAS231]|uniref:GNAT family N-acetyltransferase n=1 Tax=Afipia sp. GAS231 TaxID=1882747 RepID=UPI00087A41D7|nr:GNAT family N-acetyltransferase [Afipia sp. GAS231]SDP30520.1 putative acetyltransferase [Afipia sp. GAS231]
MGAVHRLAKPEDATDLFEIRRKAILELAPKGMPAGEAQTWAAQLTLAGMAQKLCEFEIWVAERDGVAAGWGAVHGDTLEGLYTAPEFAGRGVGTALLEMLERRMLASGADTIRAEASSNARAFYLRRGYLMSGPQTTKGAWPITKQLR